MNLRFLLSFFILSKRGISYLCFVHESDDILLLSEQFKHTHVIRDDKGSIISWFPSQSDLNRRIKESLS